MKKLEIFDPAMCCSTGICGVSIDPELMRIATVLETLKEKGICVERHGLSTTPQNFVINKKIKDILAEKDVAILPVTLVDGEIVKTKEYPTNVELSKWLDISLTEKTDDLKKENSCCCKGGKCC